ncbi:hypothetical protein E5673_05975 [Sphingomonas sp. PAMC26645]|uniref:hypothetical protein n=1 Tax=Sphingomonas sp. PAMC26645 TaxID=2565555 RepID=UPI00109DF5E6|nr:hypothetical protein [Sphingomonas sp. PAMC26645]QCB41820.1 hypothetical protein E5673_05975 [Sphingomonas sp. PAMC26645]
MEFVRGIGDELLVTASVARAASTVAITSALSGGKAVSARITICGHTKRVDCMVDGHTVWMAGMKIRIADIDTPKTHPPRCACKARLGQTATPKMQALLSAGSSTLTPIKRDVDRTAANCLSSSGARSRWTRYWLATDSRGTMAASARPGVLKHLAGRVYQAADRPH